MVPETRGKKKMRIPRWDWGVGGEPAVVHSDFVRLKQGKDPLD